MSRSHPIWCEVQTDARKNSPSFGVRDNAVIDIMVGTSARNSHAFADIQIKRRDHPNGTTTFHLYVDGEEMQRAILKDGVLTHLPV